MFGRDGSRFVCIVSAHEGLRRRLRISADSFIDSWRRNAPSDGGTCQRATERECK